jgi:hypothetical protein
MDEIASHHGMNLSFSEKDGEMVYRMARGWE